MTCALCTEPHEWESLQDKANARAADRKWQFEGYDSDGEQVKHYENRRIIQDGN